MAEVFFNAIQHPWWTMGFMLCAGFSLAVGLSPLAAMVRVTVTVSTGNNG
jgi:hypothetical protein